MSTYPEEPARTGGAGRALTLVALVAVAAIAIAWAMGLFNVDTSGKLEAPSVQVSGGEVPKVQVETGSIDVDTKTATVEVPTVEIRKAGDDGSAER